MSPSQKNPELVRSSNPVDCDFDKNSENSLTLNLPKANPKDDRPIDKTNQKTDIVSKLVQDHELNQNGRDQSYHFLFAESEDVQLKDKRHDFTKSLLESSEEVKFDG